MRPRRTVSNESPAPRAASLPARLCLALLAAFAVVGTCAGRTSADDLAASHGSVTFVDDGARSAYDDYVEFLRRDPVEFADELATLRLVESSKMEYRLRVGGDLVGYQEGSISTDGVRVLITVSAVGGPDGEIASINSRLAHEFEHARQFEMGEIGFVRDAVTGRWVADPKRYDIGDEIKAWRVQAKAANSKDLLQYRGGELHETLLRRFTRAKSDEERAEVLLKHAYKRRKSARD